MRSLRPAQPVGRRRPRPRVPRPHRADRHAGARLRWLPVRGQAPRPRHQVRAPDRAPVHTARGSRAGSVGRVRGVRRARRAGVDVRQRVRRLRHRSHTFRVGLGEDRVRGAEAVRPEQKRRPRAHHTNGGRVGGGEELRQLAVGAQVRPAAEELRSASG